MSIQNEKDFNWIYERYLTWFRQNARPAATPQDEEGLLRFSLCHEDVFEQDTVLLNQMFFIVPLLPSESITGQLQLFTFSELNMMMKSPKSDDCDVIIPVQYEVI